jgi:hypothetical protein
MRVRSPNDDQFSRDTRGIPGPRSSQSRTRNLGKLPILPTILIVSEGTKTEKIYFQSFHKAITVRGIGKETKRVVEEAFTINHAEGPFDQVWCVFDKDDASAADFDNAIMMTQNPKFKGFRAAYSHESFELWFVLHFEYVDAALNRWQYVDKLTAYLGEKYDKTDPKTITSISHKGDEAHAIANAERLLMSFAPDVPYSQRCPSTTVHELVKELRKYQSLRPR